MTLATKRPIKILFILPSLKAGGAERVISFLASNLSKQDFRSRLLIIGSKKDAAYELGNTEHKFLNKDRVLLAIPEIILAIINFRPRIVMGSIGHVNKLLASIKPIFTRTLFVGREASVGSVMSMYSSSRKSWIHKLYKDYARKLDLIICQSEDMAKDSIKRFGLKKNQIIVIHNPITKIADLKPLKSKKEEIVKFITIGRLSKEKGHNRILKVLSQVRFPFKYTIVGKGSLKQELLNTVDSLGLKDRVKWIDQTSEVLPLLRDHDIFLQGSYVEGFPNALLESLTVGTPAVAFNAPGGTKEIIVQDVNGFIANDELDFARCIEKAVHKSWSPEDIQKSVLEKFNPNIIIQKFETAFKNLVDEL